MDDAEREARRREREAWAIDTLAGRAATVEDMAARAGGPLGWLAVRRQGESYLRHLATWQSGTWFAGVKTALDGHGSVMGEWVRWADDRLASVDPDERREAEAGLGVHIAVIGKGGAGKTVISGTVSRLLGRRGRAVLAADLDVNPGLSYSLGLKDADVGLPEEALEERPGAAYGWQLRRDLLPREVVERYAVAAPDGVSVIGLGKIGGCDKMSAKRTVAAMVEVLLGFGTPGWDVIGDLEAGPTTPFERYHAFSDDVVVVVGPAWRSAMTARRLLPMVGDGRRTTVVGNRFRHVPQHSEPPLRMCIPFDPQLAEAERQGLSPLDACPDSPAIVAIGALVDHFVPEDARSRP